MFDRMQYVIDPLIETRSEYRNQITDSNGDLIGHVVFASWLGGNPFWFLDKDGNYQGMMMRTGANHEKREIQGPHKHEWRGEVSRGGIPTLDKKYMASCLLFQYAQQGKQFIAYTDDFPFSRHEKLARYKGILSNGFSVLRPDRRSIIASVRGDPRDRCIVEILTKDIDQLLLLSFIIFIVYDIK